MILVMHPICILIFGNNRSLIAERQFTKEIGIFLDNWNIVIVPH